MEQEDAVKSSPCQGLLSPRWRSHKPFQGHVSVWPPRSPEELPTRFGVASLHMSLTLTATTTEKIWPVVSDPVPARGTQAGPRKLSAAT